jgi:hypothetical protein
MLNIPHPEARSEAKPRRTAGAHAKLRAARRYSFTAPVIALT